MKKEIPKIDLHCHLDGSLPLAVMEQILGRKIFPAEVQAGEQCRNLSEYLEKFKLPIQCIQTEEGLKKAAEAFLLQLTEENVRYVEVRFAPLTSVHEGLDCRRVLEAVLEGLENARKQCGIFYNVIACAMRHHPQEQSLEMFRVCREFLGEGLCAVDLAGDEASYPMKDFRGLFEQAKKLELPFTIHAGECQNAENVMEAVECGAKRIGHGIALKGHPDYQKLCAERSIGIELCPVSNLQTRAVRTLQEYPVREFLDSGLLVTLNTDNRTVSNTRLTSEMKLVQKYFSITDEELKIIERNALEAAFADDSVKQELWKLF